MLSHEVNVLCPSLIFTLHPFFWYPIHLPAIPYHNWIIWATIIGGFPLLSIAIKFYQVFPCINYRRRIEELCKEEGLKGFILHVGDGRFILDDVNHLIPSMDFEKFCKAHHRFYDGVIIQGRVDHLFNIGLLEFQEDLMSLVKNGGKMVFLSEVNSLGCFSVENMLTVMHS